MKRSKLLVALLSGALLFSGCAQTKGKNGENVLATLKGETILTDDVYNSLLSSSQGKNALFSYVLDELIKQNFPVNDGMEENADKLVENIKMNYKNQYGSEYENYLNQQLAAGGYKDLDAYKDSLVQSLQYSEFIKKYVKDHYNDVFEDYYKYANPRLISIIKVSAENVDKLTPKEKDNLDEVKKLLKTDKSFGDIAASYSSHESKSAKGNIGIVDKSNSTSLTNMYGDKVVKEMLKLKENEVSAEIKGSDGFYFIHCQSTAKDKIKSELKTVDITSPLLTYDEYMVYLAFKTYELKFNDKKTQEIIDEVVNESLKNRKAERSAK